MIKNSNSNEIEHFCFIFNRIIFELKLPGKLFLDLTDLYFKNSLSGIVVFCKTPYCKL